MNIYHTFYKGLFEEVEGNTPLAARNTAQALFQARVGRRKVKGYDIAVVLCAVDGRVVEHSTTEI